MITFRKSTREDLPAIHGLVVELAVFEKEPDAVRASLAEYQDSYDKGIIDAILALDGEEIIGMAFYYPIFSSWNGRTLYLEDFIVKDSHRNQGIGQMLFDAFVEEAKQQGCRQAKWQVLDWNTEAIRFYERNKASIEKNWWNGRLELNAK
ncbi:MAG TPA: GNAT family N-acetyltransferase [Saprospiraceae bacterium]|nr:GNAT family N-acetyltransferase [Saprospiraceae bacterium]HRG20677.1 GNAT family N-acetyltransferase [Saprospiraceae bacterium]